MTFTFRGKEFTVTWAHTNVDNEKVSAVTSCVIKDIDGLYWGTGSAYCSIKDTFSKKQGRKISFTRAISDVSREERCALWDAYKKQVTYK